MSVQLITVGNMQVQLEVVSPAAQTSTASTVVVTGSEIDARAWRSVSYTISVITQNVDWSVFGANISTYADEVAVLAATTVAAGAHSSYAVAQAPYNYYRVKIIDTGGALHGVATVTGVAKR